MSFSNARKGKVKVKSLSHVPCLTLCRLLRFKDSDAGKDWGQEEKGATEDEMAGWYHWLDGCESAWTPGDGDRQGGLACCDSWGHKESDTTERLNWTELTSRVVFLGGASDKKPVCHWRRHKRCGFNLWVRKIPWKKAWPPTPIFLHRESHEERSLVGYSSWGLKSQTGLKKFNMYACTSRVSDWVGLG